LRNILVYIHAHTHIYIYITSPNHQCTAGLLVRNMHNIPVIVRSLTTNPPLHYSLLKAIYSLISGLEEPVCVRFGGIMRHPCSYTQRVQHIHTHTHTHILSHTLIYKHTRISTLPPPTCHLQIELPPEMHETYVELMCQQHPTGVYPYLRDNTDYRLEETLELCRKYHITGGEGRREDDWEGGCVCSALSPPQHSPPPHTPPADATAWLLERSGDIHGAFALIHQTLLQRIAALNQAFDQWEKEVAKNAALKEPLETVNLVDSRPDALKMVRAILAVALQMCKRVSAV